MKEIERLHLEQLQCKGNKTKGKYDDGGMNNEYYNEFESEQEEKTHKPCDEVRSMKKVCWTSLESLQFKDGASPEKSDCGKMSGDKCDENGVSKLLSTFADRTSLPAATYIKSANGSALRSLWCIVVLTMLSGLTFNMYFLVTSFTSFPKFTEISLGFRPLEFPAVTVCNVNPIRSSKLEMASEELQSLIEAVAPLKVIARMVKARLVYNKAIGTVSNVLKKTGIDDVVNVASKGLTHLLNHANSQLSDVSNSSREQTDEIKQDQNISLKLTGVLQENASSAFNKEENVSNDFKKEVGSNSILTSSTSRRKRSFFARLSKAFNLTLSNRNPTDGLDSGPELVSSQSPDSSSATTTEGMPVESSETRTGNKSRNEATGNKVEGPSPRNLGSSRNETRTLELLEENHQGNSFGFPSNATSILVNNSNSNSGINESLEVNYTEKGDARENDFISLATILNMALANTNWTSDVRGNERPLTDDGPFQDMSATSAIFDEFRVLFSKEKRSTRVKLGHQIDDMLVDCSFDGFRCYPSNFTLTTSSTFGNCYTIDYPGMVSRNSGFNHGLSLIMSLEQSQFLPGITSSSGGHLVVHAKNSFAFPETEGLSVPAGMQVDIALRLINIKRLNQPYGDCVSEELTGGRTYTLQACQHICVQKLNIQTCGCHNIDYREALSTFASDLEKSSHPCESAEELRCMFEVHASHSNQELLCDCNSPCSEIVYSKTLSLRQWPTQEYSLMLMESLCQRVDKSICEQYQALNPQQFALSFIKLNIFFEDLNYKNVTETPSYKSTQFVSDIGGTLGLWLGLSMITMVEFVHLIISLCKLAASKLLRLSS